MTHPEADCPPLVPELDLSFYKNVVPGPPGPDGGYVQHHITWGHFQGLVVKQTNKQINKLASKQASK